MLRYLALRGLSLALSLLVASAAIFALVDLVPGDPAQFMLGTGATSDTLAALRQQLGLDLPWPLRYARWLGGVLGGDLGTSFTYKTSVAALIGARMAVSLPLALMALGLAVAVALPVGMLAAARRGRAADAAVMGATQIGIAVPNFWFAMLLVLLFAVRLRWLPAGGFPGWDDPAAAIRALLLPAVALALPQAAILARVLRGALVETLGQDYIRTARAKGLKESVVIVKHVLKGALLPVVTYLGPALSGIVIGSVVVETVFVIPGIGKPFVQSAINRDYTLIMGEVIVYSIILVCANLIVDLVYGLLDPRISYK